MTSSFSDAFGALNASLDAAADTVVVLPLGRIYEDPGNPRTIFDTGELEALAATLRQRGLLQPIILRPADPDGRHRIRFGARRFRAAQLAGLPEVRAIVQSGEASEADTLVEQLIENEQREGLTTAEMAAAVERLLDLKLPQAEISRRIGRPRDQVALLASVRDMPEELKRLAPQLGVRTLFELHQAWKADAGRTKVWLSGREPKAITQAAARELAGRPVATRQVRDPSNGSVRDASPITDGPKRGASAPGSVAPVKIEPSTAAPSAVIGAAVFEVRAGRVRGELVLNDVQAPRSDVLVRLKDGTLRAVPASDLRIVQVRPG